MAGSSDNHNMWLIFSLLKVLSALNLPLQAQAVFLFQICQQHQSDFSALKDSVTAQNISCAYS